MLPVIVLLQLLCFLCFHSISGYGLDIPKDLLEILEQITPNFEENLRRAFINEGLHIQIMSGGTKHPLDDVLATIDNNILELRNLKLTRTPDFKVNNFTVDLTMLTINMALAPGQLQVEGEYEVTNKTLQKILPISQVGKINIVLENVTCVGRVGIYIKEDSFVVENYDVTYRPSEVSIRVSYFKEDGIEVDNEIADSDIESNQIIKSFWNQLTYVLTNILHRQLGAVIVEFSVNELFPDEEGPEKMRDFARQRALMANRLLDSLLCSAKTYLVDKGKRILEAEPLDVVFKGRPPATQQGSFKTDMGQVSDMATLTRSKEMSILEEKEILIIYGQIRLREFKLNYESYKAEYGDTVSVGSTRTTIYRNKIFVKFLVEQVNNNDCRVKLDNTHFEDVTSFGGEASGSRRFIDSLPCLHNQLDNKVDSMMLLERVKRDIDNDVSGLGALSWLKDRVRSWTIGHLRGKILYSIEREIKDAFNYAIDNTNCSNILKLTAR